MVPDTVLTHVEGFGFFHRVSTTGVFWVSRGRKVDDTAAEAKLRFLEAFQTGAGVAEAVKACGRSRSTYELWRRTDPEFVASVERIRSIREGAEFHVREELSFPEFSERFLGQRVFPHMQNVVDLIEGNQPSWVHPNMVHEPGEPDLIMVNMPPEHAKTTSITINYITYRIAMDPNIRVLIVSKTQAMAKKMLYAIKTRLTHPRYADMITSYAPPGGFDGNSEAWNAEMIYISDDARDSGEKDPTVQALGIRGHVYGARADLIVLDDCVDLTNAHEYDKQIDWIQSEVISRISSNGALLVVGTRLSSKDLYSELRDPSRYPDEVSPWTYLAMPAVLDFADKPEDWVTLWPKSNQPEAGSKGEQLEPDENGLFPKWDGPRLFKKRARVSPRSWSMVYMQRQVAEDSIFSPDAVKHAINGNRMVGPIPKGMVGQRHFGMDGLIILAGLDPATSGHTAAVCGGIDPNTGKRYILDLWNKAGMKPDEIRSVIKNWTDKYNITEWRIERNGFQGFLVHDREIGEYLANRGTLIRPHFTGANKHDEGFGVAAMSMLFDGYESDTQLIELPSTHGSEAAKALVEQLVTWSPDAPKSQKTDLVMAMWFFELACRDRVQLFGNANRAHASKSMFLTPWDMRQQQVVNLTQMEAQGNWQPITA